MKQKTGAIILAGGRSSRMHYPKCYLEVNGMTLLERLHMEYKTHADSVIVVLNSEFAQGKWEPSFRNVAEKYQVVQNSHPESGRMVSVQLGMARMNEMEYCFIQNIDNPVSSGTIEQLSAAIREADYVVPVQDGNSGHPIIISRKIMNELLNNRQMDAVLRDVLKKYRRKEVLVDSPLIHVNLNSPEDFSSFVQHRKA